MDIQTAVNQTKCTEILGNINNLVINLVKNLNKMETYVYNETIIRIGHSFNEFYMN